MAQGRDDDSLATIEHEQAEVRFFLDDTLEGEREAGNGSAPRGPAAASRLAAARAGLRDAQRAEWEERQRAARTGTDGLTPVHAALLVARQAQTQAAEAMIADLRRRAASLRQAIALAEQGLAAQQRMLDKLRRELTEIGD
jgi:hypothetical protein